MGFKSNDSNPKSSPTATHISGTGDGACGPASPKASQEETEETELRILLALFLLFAPVEPTAAGYRYTPPIHLRPSQTAFSEVRLRESKTFLAAAMRRPRFRLFQASLALMAMNWSTLGSR